MPRPRTKSDSNLPFLCVKNPQISYQAIKMEDLIKNLDFYLSQIDKTEVLHIQELFSPKCRIYRTSLTMIDSKFDLENQQLIAKPNEIIFTKTKKGIQPHIFHLELKKLRDNSISNHSKLTYQQIFGTPVGVDSIIMQGIIGEIWAIESANFDSKYVLEKTNKQSCHGIDIYQANVVTNQNGKPSEIRGYEILNDTEIINCGGNEMIGNAGDYVISIYQDSQMQIKKEEYICDNKVFKSTYLTVNSIDETVNSIINFQ